MQIAKNPTNDSADSSALSCFSLDDEQAYRQWRENKLADYPTRPEQLLVDINNGFSLATTEYQAMLANIHKTNMALYRLQNEDVSDKDLIAALGMQFGLKRLDNNLCADEDSITSVTVIPDGRQQGYIPYTNHRLSWHTDGYYNPLDDAIRSFILHCVSAASSGGENVLLDHEIAYIHLRDTNPDYISALMQPDAMTIPANIEQGVEIRGAQAGPVFSIEPARGSLHMRYTARSRSIEWKQDALTQAAAECLQAFLAGNSPYIFRQRLEKGQGVICNNVLHSRTAFDDDQEHEQARLLYRARYYDRVNDT